MTINASDQDNALRAAMQIISKCYSSAETVNGAYELTNEKIKNLYRGVRSRRNDYVSIDAISHVVVKNSKKALAETRSHFETKSVTELIEVRRKLKTTVVHWEQARRYDQIDHGGRKFVNQKREGSKVRFLFSDQRVLEFDLAACSHSTQQWLLCLSNPSKTDEINELPILIEKIEEITKWPSTLVQQALETLEPEEISILYANHHLSQFRSLLVQEERNANIPMNRIVASEIASIIQSMLDQFPSN